MHDKEIGALRRSLKAERCAGAVLTGCLVNEQHEVVSVFRQPLTTSSTDDLTAILTPLRKVLSGVQGRGLLTLPFSNAQVLDSDEHRLLMAARSQSAEGDEAVETLCRQVAENLTLEGAYILLALRDAIDLPSAKKDAMEGLESEEVFSFCLLAACPLKEQKASLGFVPTENALRALTGGSVLGAPAVGLLFPTLEDGRTSIYETLWYTKDPADVHAEVIENVLHTGVPMPADEVRDNFSEGLAGTLGEACTVKVALGLRDAFAEQLEAYKSGEREEAPGFSKQDVSHVLAECGVEAEKVDAFAEDYTRRFGDALLPPQNLVGGKRIELETPDVKISVDPERSDLISTKTIDGVKYILIRAENGVEVNGVNVTL